MKSPLNALVFGGCLLRRPLRSLPDVAGKLDYLRYGEIKTVHSFADMIQVVEFLRGEKDVPRELRRLTGIGPRMKPMPAAKDFADIDLTLIEPGSPLQVSFRGIVINHTRLQSDLFLPIMKLSLEATKLCHKWIRTGIMAMNEDVRARVGAELIKLNPDDAGRDLREAIIKETRSSPMDAVEGFRTMQKLLGRPVGAVIYIFRYMPDGRPISWPAGSRESVLAAAKELNLPIFEPIAMVQEYGVANALEADGRHYTKEFLPLIGNAIVDFAREVYAAKAQSGET
jgi:hypothetical protein